MNQMKNLQRSAKEKNIIQTRVGDDEAGKERIKKSGKYKKKKREDKKADGVKEKRNDKMKETQMIAGRCCEEKILGSLKVRNIMLKK